MVSTGAGIGRRTVLLGLAGLTTVGIAGCLGDDDGDDEGELVVADEHFDDIGIYELQLLDRGHDPHNEISYMHDDHWDRAADFPSIAEDEYLSIGAEAYDEDGQELDLWGEYELHAAVPPHGDENLVSFESHGDHVHIYGAAEGLTEIVFLLVGDGDVAYQSDGIAVTIAQDHNGDHDHDETVSEFELIDRDEDEVTAYVDGDHWHGSLPHVHKDEHLSLGANAEDDHGDEIEIDGDHWELRVDYADHDHGVVSFDHHGDHVHIIGEEEGEAEVVFELWHDDHVEYETPPIEVEVEDHDH